MARQRDITTNYVHVLPFFKWCCVIIDCREVFIERPSDLLVRAQVWSNYKHHSTLKFFIWNYPTRHDFIFCLVVQEIVERSSLLNYLLPGRNA